MAEPDLNFAHEFVPAARGSGVTLLLLHGTGGDEHDLVPLGRQLYPGAALLSPRGRVTENGMPRFFRRFAEGVFDVEDLKFRAKELNTFVTTALAHYGAPEKLVAAGYSNGANIAAGLLLLHPALLAGAVLFRAMVPFTPDAGQSPAPDLKGVHIFYGPGRRDPIVPRQDTEMLPQLLKKLGADVEVHWHAGGHELGQDDLIAAKTWLARKFPAAQTGGGA